MIQMKDMGIRYNKSIEVTSPFDIKLAFTKPNYTPLMQDNYISKDVDFKDLDISYHIQVNFSPLIMHLR